MPEPRSRTHSSSLHSRFVALRRKEDGQALVEFALVIPLLIFIVFAIIDFGLAINQYNDATNLANLAARATSVYSASNTTPASCVSGTTTYTTLVGYIHCTGAQNNSALANATVTVCDPSGTSTINTGDTLAVKVNSAFNWLGTLEGGIGNVNGLGALNSNISSTATMRMEGTATTSSAAWFSGATLTTSGC